MGQASGRVAIITGAGRGLGAHIADSLSKRGVRVVAFDIEIPVKAEGENRISFRGDVTSESDIKECLDIANEKFGMPHILINCAGIFGPSALVQYVDSADWERVIRINLTGSFLWIKHVLPSMIEAGWGRIICFASTAGVVNPPGVSPYNVSKAGVISLVRTVSQEISIDNICINALCPGNTDTPMTRSIERQPSTGQNGDRITFHRNLRVVNRYHQPQDVMDLIGFLSSEESHYISGQFIQLTSTR